MIKFKVVKPKTFKAKAFMEAVRLESEQLTREIKHDYVDTTDTWEHKPVFKSDRTVTGGGHMANVKISVTTDDKIYGYVTQGTRPHVIRARRARALRFQSGYRAKTRPRLLGSVPGGAFGEVIYAKEVQHPGTPARNFDKLIARKWKPELRKRFQSALERAAQASGHAR